MAWEKRWIACQLRMDLVHPLPRIAQVGFMTGATSFVAKRLFLLSLSLTALKLYRTASASRLWRPSHAARHMRHGCHHRLSCAECLMK